jgi:FAD/FMN-containing dehydrogenase
MAELNLATSLQNFTVLGAGEASVVYSGYVTGGGHNPLAPTYGLAVDVVYEMELVTPGGDILIVNEC